MKHLIFVLFFIPTVLMAQEPETDSVRIQKKYFQNESFFFVSDSLFDKDGYIDLGSRDGWRFHPGDDLNWADPDFDDSDWIFYTPSGLTEPIPDSLWQGYGWFRFRLAADSLVYEKVKHLTFFTFGAAEVYLDGKLVKKCGTFSTDAKDERSVISDTWYNAVMVLQPYESHAMAVRFSYHRGPVVKKLFGKTPSTFGFEVGIAKDNYNQDFISIINSSDRLTYISGTMLFLVVLLHALLFILFQAERSNLYIAVVSFLLFLHNVGIHVILSLELDYVKYFISWRFVSSFLFLGALSMFPFTISLMFNQKPCSVHKMLIWLFPVFSLADIILSDPKLKFLNSIIFIVAVIFYSSRILIQAAKNKQAGTWFVAGGFLGLLVGNVATDFYLIFSQNNNYQIIMVLLYLTYASIPVGLIAFMASKFKDLYKNLEQKVKERTRELNQSLENLRSTQSQLIQSEKLASLGQPTAGIAHEIQNPLNFVNNFSEVNTELIDEALDENEKGNHSEVKSILNDLKENESKIIHHGKRADSIVKGMLLHSRGSSGHKESTDINAMADEYLRLSYHGFRAKDKSFNADFKLEADKSLPKIEVVPQDIGRVLLNLINNAFYAVSEQSKLFQSSELWKSYQPLVTVSTIKLNDRIQISVKDNGPGIPLEIKDKIFQPFFTTKPTGQGTGLGLSIAYDMMKAHGGEIRVETKKGVGTEFIIQLPAS
jgi:signal transduction histidine kinase